MHIQLNGQARPIQAQTLQQLISELELVGKRIAVEHNLHIIPRSEWADTQLNDGDRIEIVHAIGGG